MKDSKKTKIQILTDENSWFLEYAKNLEKLLAKKGNKVKIITKKGDIEKGDIIFVLSWSSILPKELLELNKRNIVIHASSLPRGKGWAPLTWQILKGKNKIPLSLFEMREKVDAGPIYMQDIIELEGNELLEDIHKKAGLKIINMAISFADSWQSAAAKEQEGKETFYKRRTPEDSELNIEESIKSQFNLLRVVDNKRYPAFFRYQGIKYIVKIYKEKNK